MLCFYKFCMTLEPEILRISVLESFCDCGGSRGRRVQNCGRGFTDPVARLELGVNALVKSALAPFLLTVSLRKPGPLHSVMEKGRVSH